MTTVKMDFKTFLMSVFLPLFNQTNQKCQLEPPLSPVARGFSSGSVYIDFCPHSSYSEIVGIPIGSARRAAMNALLQIKVRRLSATTIINRLRGLE